MKVYEDITGCRIITEDTYTVLGKDLVLTNLRTGTNKDKEIGILKKLEEDGNTIFSYKSSACNAKRLLEKAKGLGISEEKFAHLLKVYYKGGITFKEVCDNILSIMKKKTHYTDITGITLHPNDEVIAVGVFTGYSEKATLPNTDEECVKKIAQYKARGYVLFLREQDATKASDIIESIPEDVWIEKRLQLIEQTLNSDTTKKVKEEPKKKEELTEEPLHGLEYLKKYGDINNY